MIDSKTMKALRPFYSYLEKSQENRNIEKDWDYSITELLAPPYQAKLKERHKDNIEPSPKSAVSQVTGSVIHDILYRQVQDKPESYLAEQRIYGNIGESVISGKFDLYDKVDKILYDYKYTSVYSIGNERRLDEWKYQLNMYKILMEANEIPVSEMYVIAILKDWGEKHASEIPLPIHIVEIEKIGTIEIVDWFKQKLNLHKNSTEFCNEIERWQEPAKYSVFKKDGKRACSGGAGFLDRSDAEKYIEMHKTPDDLEIREFKSLPRRCMNYCEVSKYCEWYQNWQKEQKDEK